MFKKKLIQMTKIHNKITTTLTKIIVKPENIK